MTSRDHGGGLDAAIARYGGTRCDWLDLSTGINPVPYPVGEIAPEVWTALPDQAASDRLLRAARSFWNVPEEAQIVAAPGASAVIAALPQLTEYVGIYIPGPTYNEHAAAFHAHGKLIDIDDAEAANHVYVHPNNPDGKLWSAGVMGGRALTVIDESFCDTCPDATHVSLAADHGIVVLKSFGKFWGLAGLRLGFAIGRQSTLSPIWGADSIGGGVPGATLADMLGPWPVSGPALAIGARALSDTAWAKDTRKRLTQDAARLDAVMAPRANLVGGTDLFRLYDVDDAAAWQEKLARNHIWSRIFPYSKTWLRLGLPAPNRWDQLKAAV